VVRFGRDAPGDLALAELREWLCTNGIGGFAMGTVAGSLARRYHGLLVAALSPPLGRTLLVAKLEEVVTYGGAAWEIGANRWRGGAVAPEGHRFIERIRLEVGTPVWAIRPGALQDQWEPPGCARFPRALGPAHRRVRRGQPRRGLRR